MDHFEWWKYWKNWNEWGEIQSWTVESAPREVELQNKLHWISSNLRLVSEINNRTIELNDLSMNFSWLDWVVEENRAEIEKLNVKQSEATTKIRQDVLWLTPEQIKGLQVLWNTFYPLLKDIAWDLIIDAWISMIPLM